MILTKIEMLDPNKFILIVADTEEETIKTSSPFFNRRNAERLEKIVLEDGDICEMCGGTGEVDCMENVYPNEPHMAMVGSRKCECQIKEEEPEE